MFGSTYVEALESRSLFAASPVLPAAFIDGATLRIKGAVNTGTVISITTGDSGNTIFVQFNGRAARAFSKDAIADLEIVGGKKNDRVTVREDGGRISLPIQIRVGQGNDTVDLDLTSATVLGGSGNDTLLGSDGDDRLLGEDGNDKIYGGPGDDRLGGGDGNDDIRGDAGDDFVNGEKGNDTLDGGAGSDTLDGGTGRNRLVDYAASGEQNIFYGGRGINDIYGSRSDEYRDIDRWYDRIYYKR